MRKSSLIILIRNKERASSIILLQVILAGDENRMVERNQIHQMVYAMDIQVETDSMEEIIDVIEAVKSPVSTRMKKNDRGGNKKNKGEAQELQSKKIKVAHV
ncbi:hypothetical protein AMTRI_Chr13g84950 [Amborella trichopoda]|uniref:Uncharacterized protein n=1 Tax=Amborella trichopoda TaxID=13333 RepID=W1P9I3_AMBTC|nr:hypothetical protein AMTR_s00147p00021450 [Amborella trichopoda]